MVFEKPIAYKPERKMSMCHGFTTMLNELVTLCDDQLQTILVTDDMETAVVAVETVCDLIKAYLDKVGENYGEEEEIEIRCEILR